MDYRDLQAGQKPESSWFKAKNNLIQVLMEKVCQNKKNLRILNIGAGTGNDLKILQKFGENFVIDIDPKVLAVADEKLCVEKKLADACKLPYDDNFFDIVVSFDVFEHIKDDHQAAKEAYRVLKQDGALIFTVPAFQTLFSCHDKALLHHRRYNKKTLKNLLSPFGNIKIFFWNSLLFFPTSVIRILKKKSKPQIDQLNLSPWLNNFIYKLLLAEIFLIKKNISLPVGLSLVGFCYKKRSSD